MTDPTPGDSKLSEAVDPAALIGEAAASILEGTSLPTESGPPVSTGGSSASPTLEGIHSTNPVVTANDQELVSDEVLTAEHLPVDIAGEGEFQKISLGFVNAESFTGKLIAGVVSILSVIVFGSWVVMWLFGIIWFGTVFWVLVTIATVIALFFGLFPRYWAMREYCHASWRLTDSGLEIRRGVWWRHRITLPRDRVQHIDVVQGPIMRKYGIAKLVIHTAGTHCPSVELPGLLIADAESLRNQMTSVSS